MSTKNNNSADERLLNVKKQKNEKRDGGLFFYTSAPHYKPKCLSRNYIPNDDMSIILDLEEKIKTDALSKYLKSDWVFYFAFDDVKNTDEKFAADSTCSDIFEFFVIEALKYMWERTFFSEKHIDVVMKHFISDYDPKNPFHIKATGEMKKLVSRLNF